MIASRALKLQAERLLHCGADSGERGQFARLDPELGLARIGRQEPREVAWRRQRRLVQHHALEKSLETLALLVRSSTGMSSLGPKVVLVGRQPIRFQHGAVGLRIGSHEQKVAVVGHEDLPIPAPVIFDLLRLRDPPRVRAGRLGLDSASRRDGARAQVIHVIPGLLLGKQTTVRYPGPGVLKVDDALHLGLECLADLVEQGGERGVVRGFLHRRAGGAHGPEFLKVGLQRVHGRILICTTARREQDWSSCKWFCFLVLVVSAVGIEPTT